MIYSYYNDYLRRRVTRPCYDTHVLVWYFSIPCMHHYHSFTINHAKSERHFIIILLFHQQIYLICDTCLSRCMS